MPTVHRPTLFFCILVEKSSKNNALLSIVGHVVEQHLDCGPTGNYITGEFRSLEKAKYQLQLTKLMGTPFVKDYDIALNTSKNMQGQVAATGDRRNFIIADSKNENFRFTKDVFKKKSASLTHAQYNMCSCSPGSKHSLSTN
ncbi:hypothetical protein EI94DRAFT_1690985 [Lactarius quietus]|nr:hypothetical protein EI94DRAFT_1690985 [Lactarius quietus]